MLGCHVRPASHCNPKKLFPAESSFISLTTPFRLSEKAIPLHRRKFSVPRLTAIIRIFATFFCRWAGAEKSILRKVMSIIIVPFVKKQSLLRIPHRLRYGRDGVSRTKSNRIGRLPNTRCTKSSVEIEFDVTHEYGGRSVHRIDHRNLRDRAWEINRHKRRRPCHPAIGCFVNCNGATLIFKDSPTQRIAIFRPDSGTNQPVILIEKKSATDGSGKRLQEFPCVFLCLDRKRTSHNDRCYQKRHKNNSQPEPHPLQWMAYR